MSTRVKKRRKYNIPRLLLVAGIFLILVGGLLFAGWKGIQALTASGKPEVIVLDSGEEAKPEDINDLHPRILDFMSLKKLSHLRGDIQTFMFNNELNDLRDSINDYLSQNQIDPEKISWAVEDLTTGAYIESDNATSNFVAASTYKMPLSMLWYERVANGTATMDQLFTFTEQMLEEEDSENPYQPIGRKFKVGDRIPLSQLLEAALLYSDNIAGHILFEALGGYSSYKYEAARYSDSPQERDFFNENKLNTDYTMDLVRYFYTTPGVFDEAKYWLTWGAPNLYLNQNAQYGYIQKIGNIDEVRNAIGYMPTQFPFSVSVYSCIDATQGQQVIGDIGSICYDYFYNRYTQGDYTEEEMALAQSRAAIGNPIVQLESLPELPADERSTLEHPHGLRNDTAVTTPAAPGNIEPQTVSQETPEVLDPALAENTEPAPAVETGI